MRLIPLLAALAIGETSFAQPVGAGSIAPGTSAISGVLIDAQTKQPVAGCLVALNQLHVLSRSAMTKTDGSGAYAFAGIGDAEYHVNTFCDSHLPACFRSAGAQPMLCEAVAVVRDQRRSNIDLQLIKGATARGKVIDATGRPIAGAIVKLGMPRFDARYGISKAAATGHDGTFELTNLPSGGWLVEAELPQEPGALRPPTLYYPGVVLTGEASFIELVPGRTTDDVTIVAPRLADNKLTVRVVTLEQLTDLDVSFVRVEPLVSRKVTLDGVRVGASWFQEGVEVNPLDITEAPVAANGTFTLEGLFGTRKLQLMGLGPEWEIRSIVQDRSDVTASGVTLTADTEAKVVITVGRR